MTFKGRLAGTRSKCSLHNLDVSGCREHYSTTWTSPNIPKQTMIMIKYIMTLLIGTILCFAGQVHDTLMSTPHNSIYY